MHSPVETDENTRASLARRVLDVTNSKFDGLALDIFAYQFSHNSTYRQYCELLGRTPRNVTAVSAIPFLPVSIFKHRLIQTNAWAPEVVFESSRTTGQIPSRHAIRDLGFYHSVSRLGFRQSTGQPVSDFQWLALLPSYTERPGSSLVSMVRHFISLGKPGGKFITQETAHEELSKANESGIPSALISVSFALTELAQGKPLQLRNMVIIETGGMKGRQPEMTRDSLHVALTTFFGLPSIWSEYGMTELQSQGWSTGHGVFRCAPTLKVYIRDLTDPLTLLGSGERGAINCIDLANLDTCAFIATDDIGIVLENGAFKILGRIDGSELRGCNLMFVE